MTTIDYYQNFISNPKDIRHTSQKTKTLYIDLDIRDKKKYPNKFNQIIELPNPISDIYFIEIAKIMHNISIPYINNQNNNFTIEYNDEIFSINLPNIDSDNSIKDKFNEIYTTYVQHLLRTKLEKKNISIIPVIELKYNTLSEKYYILSSYENNTNKNYDMLKIFNKKQLFLEQLGFKNNIDNKIISNTNNINIYNSKYIGSEISIDSIRLLFGNNEIENIGSNYNNKLYLVNNTPNVINTFQNGNFANNKIPIDYLVQLKVKKIYKDIIKIKLLKSSDLHLINQIKNGIFSSDTDSSIKIEFHNNNNIYKGSLELNNLTRSISTCYKTSNDFTYFNNINQIDYSENKNVQTGYSGFEENSNEFILYWSILSYREIESNDQIFLTSSEIYSIINSDIYTEIFQNDSNDINYNNLFSINNNKFVKEISNISFTNDTYFFENTNLELTYYFNYIIATDKIKVYNGHYFLIDIEEFNDKESNNQNISKSFLELTDGNIKSIDYDANYAHCHYYFNPPMPKLNKLSIKIKDNNGNILEDNNNSFILILHIKQINENIGIIPIRN